MSTTTTKRIGRAKPLARGTDGPGSHAAADALKDSGVYDKQIMVVLAALRRLPFRTSKQLAEDAGLERHLVGRRLPDLENEGWAVSRNDTKEKTWSMTDAGWAALDEYRRLHP